MNFLSPFTALLAAAITIPLLLLLYFLKLRRRYLRMASTLLWRRSFEDLEVNAPFQRLRWSILLLLQLLILLSLLLAVAQPVADGGGDSATRLILLIDRSASMNVVETSDGRTRLDEAKLIAKQMVDRLGRSGSAREVMIISFGSSAHVVSTFQFDRPTLARAIDSIEATDEEANLGAALQLASGFAGHTEDAAEQAAEIVLLSDGGVEPPDDPAGFRLRAGSFRYVQVGQGGERVDNVGIAALSARRDYENPARVLVFVRLVNAGGSEIETVLTVRIDDEVADVRRIVVPAASVVESSDASAEFIQHGPLGEAPMTFAIDLPGGGLISVSHNHQDALAGDDRAFLVMPPPAQPRVAIVNGEPVSEDDFIVPLMLNFEPAALNAYSPETFATLDLRELDAGALYDLVVFNRVSGHRLPGIPSVTLGGVPRGVGAIEPASEGGKRILSWDRQHPVMRQVSLDAVAYTGFGAYELPHGAIPLALGPDGPVIATLATRGARHVLVGFPLDLSRTNWPLHVSVAVFMQNTVEYLTLAGSGQVGLAHQPGQPIAVRVAPDASLLRIEGPLRADIPVEPGTMRTLPALRRAGVYQVEGATTPGDQIAVSVLSDRESDVRPRSQLLVNAQPAEATGAGEVVPRELWPWVLAAALALITLEWLAYLRKSR